MILSLCTLQTAHCYNCIKCKESITRIMHHPRCNKNESETSEFMQKKKIVHFTFNFDFKIFTSSCSFCFDLSWHWSRMPLNSSKFVASPIFFFYFLVVVHGFLSLSLSIYSANRTFWTFKHLKREATTKK